MEKHVLLPTLGILAAAGCGGGLESTNRSDAEQLVSTSRASTRDALAQLGVEQEGIQPDGSVVTCDYWSPLAGKTFTAVKQQVQKLALADAAAAACGSVISVKDGRVEATGLGQPKISGLESSKIVKGENPDGSTEICVRLKTKGVECNK